MARNSPFQDRVIYFGPMAVSYTHLDVYKRQDAGCFVAGSCLYAISVSVFAAPNQIAPGGVTGLATILNTLIHTPIGTVAFLLNIPRCV